MIQLPYNPANGPRFWDAISKLDGYPRGEHMPIKHMLFESDALFKTSEILKSIGADKSNPLLVVMDQTAMRRGDESLKPLAIRALQNDGWQIKPLVMLPDKSGQVHTEMPRIKGVQARLTRGCTLLSIGSGVITDIAKHACYLYQKETGEKIPFVVYQTANSVSAFTSNMAPTFVDGVKRTLDSRYPDALICDLETLRDAPKEMTAAGVGDMLAVFVSIPDWILTNRLGLDDTYSELAKQLLGPIDDALASCAENIQNIEGASLLAKVISLGGLAMSLSHATTPLSGFEHVMSHVIDLQAEMKGEPLAAHGSQVALTSIVGAEMYRRFLSDPSTRSGQGFEPASVDLTSCYSKIDSAKARVESSFLTIDPSGKAGAECWSDYKQKLEAWHEHRKDFEAALPDWPAIRGRLQQETRPPETLIHILRTMGAPLNWNQLTPPISHERAKFAFMHASLIRKRFTLGDLLIFLDWDREGLWGQKHHTR
jgi:glycerol-1-phosphate dehydrogenase [NAD(P)+]